MITLAKRRREQERHKRLDEAFREADSNNSGKITKDQMVKIYAANDCIVPNLEEDVRKLCDRLGEIKYGDFIRYAQGTDLLKAEFQDRVFSKVEIDTDKAGSKKDTSKKTKADGATATASTAARIDKVELAFRKFDTNKDGFLSREEFDEMMKDVEKRQADRIFRSCDQSKNGKISLEEFRSVLQRGKEKMVAQQGASNTKQQQEQQQQTTTNVQEKKKKA